MSVPYIQKPISLANKVVPRIPVWIYKWLAIMPFTGFFGFDHWALGSKFTGLAKLAVNLATFGSWYAFDIIQVWYKQDLRSEGLEYPFIEYGSIGKGKFDDEGLSNMSKNTQMWLLFVFIGLFLGIYYLTTFYISSSSDISSVVIKSISIFTFYIGLGLLAYTVFFYITTKSANLLSSAVATSRSGVKSNLYTQFGLANPLTTKKASSSSLVGRTLGLSGLSKATSLPTLIKGGSKDGMDDMKEILQKIVTKDNKPNDYIYFSLLLVMLPLSGFIAYGLRRNMYNVKKDETIVDTN